MNKRIYNSSKLTPIRSNNNVVNVFAVNRFSKGLRYLTVTWTFDDSIFKFLPTKVQSFLSRSILTLNRLFQQIWIIRNGTDSLDFNSSFVCTVNSGPYERKNQVYSIRQSVDDLSQHMLALSCHRKPSVHVAELLNPYFKHRSCHTDVERVCIYTQGGTRAWIICFY